jgi:hypothetical protein
MSNSLTKFEDDAPPGDHVYLYWDRERKEWRIWFADPNGTGEPEFPMFKSGDYDRFDYKLHRYRLVRE